MELDFNQRIEWFGSMKREDVEALLRQSKLKFTPGASDKELVKILSEKINVHKDEIGYFYVCNGVTIDDFFY